MVLIYCNILVYKDVTHESSKQLIYSNSNVYLLLIICYCLLDLILVTISCSKQMLILHILLRQLFVCSNHLTFLILILIYKLH